MEARVKGVASISVQLTSIRGDSATSHHDRDDTPPGAHHQEKDAVKVGIGAGIGAAIRAVPGADRVQRSGQARGRGKHGLVLATHGDLPSSRPKAL
jgi:hypothetical protein